MYIVYLRYNIKAKEAPMNSLNLGSVFFMNETCNTKFIYLFSFSEVSENNGEAFFVQRKCSTYRRKNMKKNTCEIFSGYSYGVSKSPWPLPKLHFPKPHN